ncbi:hypothetical protein [Priestia megaterium]|uniref:hypothetical protein n=1 Tax=Priestia megaterium TaxID=1404 RepID=UPI002877EB22|nr:hypothetical protein [Priestia megaterium]MBX4162758.1 hypothetical protein [Priestia megaterium]
MSKGKSFLILFVLLISIALFFFVLKEDGEIKRDNIEIGYKTNDESQQIINPRNKVDRNKEIIVSAHFKANSGKEKQNKRFVLNLANIEDKSNVLIKKLFLMMRVLRVMNLKLVQGNYLRESFFV